MLNKDSSLRQRSPRDFSPRSLEAQRKFEELATDADDQKKPLTSTRKWNLSPVIFGAIITLCATFGVVSVWHPIGNTPQLAEPRTLIDLNGGVVNYYSTSPNVMESRWQDFKIFYNRTYGQNDTERFAVFVNNLRIIDEQNNQYIAAGYDKVFGITKFADLAQEEFSAKYLGARVPDSLKKMPRSAKPGKHKGVYGKDWTGVYTTTRINDQGNCEACWAFSAAEQMESDTIRNFGVTYNLSAQQLIDCDPNSQGCSGGWTTTAWDYVKAAGGLELDADYPFTDYSPSQRSCYKVRNPVVQLVNYTGVGDVKQYIGTTGPLSATLDATWWQLYTHGIFWTGCGGLNPNHAIQIVGVSTRHGYYKIRNSWGESWGEDGYIRVGIEYCNLEYVYFTDTSLVATPTPTAKPTTAPSKKAATPTTAPSTTPTAPPTTTTPSMKHTTTPSQKPATPTGAPSTTPTAPPTTTPKHTAAPSKKPATPTTAPSTTPTAPPTRTHHTRKLTTAST